MTSAERCRLDLNRLVDLGNGEGQIEIGALAKHQRHILLRRPKTPFSAVTPVFSYGQERRIKIAGLVSSRCANRALSVLIILTRRLGVALPVASVTLPEMEASPCARAIGAASVMANIRAATEVQFTMVFRRDPADVERALHCVMCENSQSHKSLIHSCFLSSVSGKHRLVGRIPRLSSVSQLTCRS